MAGGWGLVNQYLSCQVAVSVPASVCEGEGEGDNDSSGDSASSGSDDSSDDDSNGAESDSESSDVDMGVEPDCPSVSVAPVGSKVAAPEVQLPSWDPTANVSSAADTVQGSLGECTSICSPSSRCDRLGCVTLGLTYGDFVCSGRFLRWSQISNPQQVSTELLQSPQEPTRPGSVFLCPLIWRRVCASVRHQQWCCDHPNHPRVPHSFHREHGLPAYCTTTCP